MGLITNLLTKSKTQIPLLYVTFDYKKFTESGKAGSCMANVHPLIKNDEHIIQSINDLVDYIRDNYDMSEM